MSKSDAFPFTCIACRTDRHDLCSAPDHVFCECKAGVCAKKRTHPVDISTTTVSSHGEVVPCAMTKAQYERAVEKNAGLHFVRFQESTSGGGSGGGD